MPRVFLNVYLVGTNTPDTVQADIAETNRIYRVVNIDFVLRHQSRIPDTEIVNPDNGKFYESKLPLLGANTSVTQERDCIDIYYMNEWYSKDYLGVTVRPGPDKPVDAYGNFPPPIRPICVLNATTKRQKTLGHELGHALLNDGSHHTNPQNLMAADGLPGTTLDAQQIQIIRQSPYVRP